jgi:hypothetical protein
MLLKLCSRLANKHENQAEGFGIGGKVASSIFALFSSCRGPVYLQRCSLSRMVAAQNRIAGLPRDITCTWHKQCQTLALASFLQHPFGAKQTVCRRQCSWINFVHVAMGRNWIWHRWRDGTLTANTDIDIDLTKRHVALNGRCNGAVKWSAAYMLV